MVVSIMRSFSLLAYAFGFQIVLCTSAALFAQPKPIKPQQPFTVCYVLQNLDSLGGKIIQVRGAWYGGEMREECKTQLKTEDHVWPSAIYLVTTDFLDKEDEPVDWIFLGDDFEKAFRERNRYKGPVNATIIGRLDARAELSPDPGGGHPVPFGYGHLNAYPARIVIMEIKDIVGSELRKAGEEIEIIYTDD